MSSDWTPILVRKRAVRSPVDRDLPDSELLDFALEFAGPAPAPPTASRLLAEFGDVEGVLTSEPEVLSQRGGLAPRAVAILKLLNAFRHDGRRPLLH